MSRRKLTFLQRGELYLANLDLLSKGPPNSDNFFPLMLVFFPSVSMNADEKTLGRFQPR